jgi:hypothetical protein
MRTRIDDMIDVISSDIPHFLNGSRRSDIEAFNELSYLILMAKILCVDTTLSIKAIDRFSDDFFERINYMTELLEDDYKAEQCYDYVTQFYHNLFTYLVNNEEYEMCSNFRNFIERFNKKVDEINEL